MNPFRNARPLAGAITLSYPTRTTITRKKRSVSRKSRIHALQNFVGPLIDPHHQNSYVAPGAVSC